MRIQSPTRRRSPQQNGAQLHRAVGGFVMLEMLLVVAVVAVVSCSSLRSQANQRKVNMEVEAMAEDSERRNALGWFTTELPDGSTVWSREF